MSKPELYVVNTAIPPTFLDLEFSFANPRGADAKHRQFIERVRTQHSGFGLPYVALFPDGGLQIPLPGPLRGGVIGRVHDGMANGMSLDEFLARKVDPGLQQWEERVPITAIVEFSPKELYPDAMQRLGLRYELKRITVE